MDVDDLRIEQRGVSAAIAPGRGAIVTALSVGNREVLYMDRSTLLDPTRSVRGGIPLLFPFAGRLQDDKLTYAGTTMKQHGFARNKQWSVESRSSGAARLALDDDEQTRAVYPHSFRLEQTVTLIAGGLQIELAVHNRGAEAMPVAPGWHPYFSCPAAARPQVRPVHGEVPAERFTDDAEFDFGVTAPANGCAEFDIPAMGRLALTFSPEMRFLQCWGLPGRDFICLEPFLGPINAINTGQRLVIPVGKTHVFWMQIQLRT